MATPILFFHGGGSAADYEADQKLADSLKKHLGPEYAVQYPFLPDDGSPDLGRRQQISAAIANSDDGVILVAHSFGASMLLACLSELPVQRRIAGVFLLATPFWQGTEDWVQPFRLLPDFSDRLDQDIPLFLYHSRDDEEVPFAHFEIYRQKLPWANFQVVPGGHQLNDDLSLVAHHIASLSEKHQNH